MAGRAARVKPAPRAEDLLVQARRVQMSRVPRWRAPDGSGQVGSRGHNRAFLVPTPADCARGPDHPRERGRTAGVLLSASTVRANLGHLPLRWFLPQPAKASPRARGSRGPFRERRYRACRIAANHSARVALRDRDRHPVCAGLVEDPAADPWARCASRRWSCHAFPRPRPPELPRAEPLFGLPPAARPAPAGASRCPSGRRPRAPVDDSARGRAPGGRGPRAPAAPSPAET